MRTIARFTHDTKFVTSVIVVPEGGEPGRFYWALLDWKSLTPLHNYVGPYSTVKHCVDEVEELLKKRDRVL